MFRYLDNIIEHPDEEKYRKIRKNNKVFCEKVAPAEGCEEFLEACGFKRTQDGTGELMHDVTAISRTVTWYLIVGLADYNWL